MSTPPSSTWTLPAELYAAGFDIVPAGAFAGAPGGRDGAAGRDASGYFAVVFVQGGACPSWPSAPTNAARQSAEALLGREVLPQRQAEELLERRGTPLP